MSSIMAEGGAVEGWSGGKNGNVDLDNLDPLSIDAKDLLTILDEPSGPSPELQSGLGLEDMVSQNMEVELGRDAGDRGNFQNQSGFEVSDVSGADPAMFYVNSCYSQAFGSGILGLSHPFETGGRRGQCSLPHWDRVVERVGVLQSDAANSSTTSSLDTGNFDFLSAQAGFSAYNTFQNASCGSLMDSPDTIFEYDGAFNSGTHDTSGLSIDLNSDAGEFGSHCASALSTINSDVNFFTDSLRPHILYDNGSFGFVAKDEVKEFHTEGASIASDILMINQSDAKELCFKSKGGDCMLSIGGNLPSVYSQPGISKEQSFSPKDQKVDEVEAHRSRIWGSYETSNDPDLSVDNNSKNLLNGASATVPIWKHFLVSQDRKVDVHSAYAGCQLDSVPDRFPVNCSNSSSRAKEHHLPSDKSSRQINVLKDEEGCKLPMVFNSSRVSPESIQSNSSSSKSHVDDDSDICIIEDVSPPARSLHSLSLERGMVPQRVAYSDLHYTGVEGTKFRPTDERFVFQAALQDLSQANSEALPPDGFLAVPLLRHQRIALSWMVQMETSSPYCSGGILADDQGLGKTVSTIALILKERPPALRVDMQVMKKEEVETLDLDSNDEDTEVSGKKQDTDGFPVVPNRKLMRDRDSSGKSKGRPAAGTLVICPTSVLRQWADELHKKVTREANLSVLVYHGSNRTKDPFELAKYDVVVTTYSIVSMEVPKQPLVDEDADEKVNVDAEDRRLLELSLKKKRKYPSSSGKSPKGKKGMDNALLESMARPLAKVAWFRVVLDEAQSIKNHRTQVARACWGLRAKRRWCLSGTPIQNAIDDLYSYFRFLKYDPYAVYKSFCSTIKFPIQKNPMNGYRKLQAVLKMVMLRRTKGTLLDGEPIITLPPKVVELKKVEFTTEERDFYTKLETDSRAQFKEYADAGTVKQNYVNILLMLLRLRQACDHPCLVSGIDSDSLRRRSIEMAKKLSQEQQIHLLNCLEASLAICGICNDPPEDAIVSVCGHVFCNQCICEHLTGDDNQCPVTNCKQRLNVSSVFSKATLNSSLSSQPVVGPGSEPVEKPYSAGCPLDSSKIRAALEVLQSLTKPQDHTSADSSLEKSSIENASSFESSSRNSFSDNNDKTDVEENRNHSCRAAGEKAIVFSQWTRMLDLLEACLKNSCIQYRRLDGTMSVAARDKAVKDFNTLPEVSVMIMSLKAASLGLNMVAACHVLLLDLWWNPTTEDQAIDRAHRIGQTRPVNVLRLTVRDTVEDRILALQQKKREMVALAFGEDETGGRQSRLTEEDLNYLFMA